MPLNSTAEPARVVVHPVVEDRGVVRLAASLIEADGATQELWWELPASHKDLMTNWSDPWVTGFLFPIMQRNRSVHIEGRVSPSQLANAESFMHIWAKWQPHKYYPVELTAEQIIDQPPALYPGVAVASFSCGLDSCFTVYRHARGLVGRRSRRIGLGIIQHGFDVTLDQDHGADVFRDLQSDATAMLSSLGIPCLPLKTNFRRLDVDWAHALGSQLVCGMSLLSRGYDVGLVANDVPYFEMNANPWPLHPITSRMLGSDCFQIIDDGFECSRIEKARTVADWPHAMRHLRVCFGINVPGSHENCGYCDKCLRTLLAFRVAGCSKPASFNEQASDRAIRSVRLAPSTRASWKLLAERAQAEGLGGTSWAKAIQAALRRDRWRTWRSRVLKPFVPIRSAFRQLTRGADISRSQMKEVANANSRQGGSWTGARDR